MRFVPFVEAAELEMIEAESMDRAIELIKQQIRIFHKEGFELGLHLHPQWYNARHENQKWTWIITNIIFALCPGSECLKLSSGLSHIYAIFYANRILRLFPFGRVIGCFNQLKLRRTCWLSMA